MHYVIVELTKGQVTAVYGPTSESNADLTATNLRSHAEPDVIYIIRTLKSVPV